MKISKDLRNLTTTQVELARALGITQPRVHQLIQDGIVCRDNHGSVLVVESLKNYYHTQGVASDADDSIDYMIEKAKHEKTKREIAELKLAKMEASAYDAKTVELVLTEMLSNLRTQLLGLPSKLAPQLEGKTKESVYTTLTREIEDKLSELSEYKPELFTQEEIVDGVDDEDSE